ncbi:MAG: hypothetical protein U1D67_09980, partial [Dehalococcoidia bacterium]|nr:hypothetical protein [Dehalococcoidia bacterium]
DIPFLSGCDTWNTQIVDEYGDYTQDLGSSLQGTVYLEAWVRGNDQDGRTYTVQRTAWDLAGNVAYIEAVSTVVK